MQPTMRMRTSMGASPASTALGLRNGAVFKKTAPALAWLSATFVVAWYVKRQLGRESGDFDHIFAQKNTPESEEARKKALNVDVYGDPRNTFLNLLGWTK